MRTTVWTIGHSNSSTERVLGLLADQGVEAVADIRTTPRSRWVPQFDASALRLSAGAAGISYVPMGETLGGRPGGAEFYDEEDHVLYGRLTVAPRFLDGVGRLLTLATRSRVAMMYSEEDPVGCHCQLLIGRVLSDRGVEMLHLRHDGTAETYGTVCAREPARQGGLFDADTWRSAKPVRR